MAKARRILDPAPPHAGEDGLPADAAAGEALLGAAAGAQGAAPPGRRAGLDEAPAGQQQGAPHRMEAERPAERRVQALAGQRARGGRPQ